MTIKDRYDRDKLPQVWDELRRKVGDVQGSLPPGAGPSIVVDDYGDVFGVFVAVYGAEYSYADLKQVVDLLRREFALVQDVAKVETFGERVEAIYVVLSVSMTVLAVPYLALQPEMALGYDARTSLNAYRNAGSLVGVFAAIAVRPTGRAGRKSGILFA